MQDSSYSRFKETLIVGGFANALLLALSWPAFKYYFYAEAFWALRIYNQNGRHLWQAAFSKIDGMFFRPGFLLAHLAWIFILPPNPFIYHIRNFVFCAINVFLLYSVLSKLVRSRSARVIAIGLFAASKMHLTIIGSINTYEASMLLMTELLTILFWIRYIESHRTMDYFLTLIFCALNVFSKDNGFLVIGVQASVVLALAVQAGDIRRQFKYWAVRFVPFVVLAGFYVVLRYILTGPLNSDNPVYSPRLSFSVAAQQATGFLATIGNFALTNPGTMGTRGLSGLLTGNSKLIEFLLCALLWLLVLHLVWRARSSWRLLILPLAWIGAYLLPVFLIRNHQVYYYQEPLVGVSLLIGICLDQANQLMLRIWVLVVAIIALNGFISNRRSYYDWEFTANRAEIVKPLIEARRGNPPESIILASSPENLSFWVFTLNEPMVPFLLGSPETLARVVDRRTIAGFDRFTEGQPQGSQRTVLFDLDKGVVRLSPSTIADPLGIPSVAPASATITANPNPIQVCDGSGLGITTISYTLALQGLVEVHVNSPDGALFARTSASGSLTTARWVTDGMVFFLQDVSDGKPLTSKNTIDKLTVNLTRNGCP